jgi:hypothetical protein
MITRIRNVYMPEREEGNTFALVLWRIPEAKEEGSNTWVQDSTKPGPERIELRDGLTRQQLAELGQGIIAALAEDF